MLKGTLRGILGSVPETYKEPCQTSIMESFEKMAHG